MIYEACLVEVLVTLVRRSARGYLRAQMWA